ncbi:hypothetical protein BDZ94DRAFT_1252170 [Collybia nuda]|uniref:Uncharacterized protein n=1 Tax=Collybia nuda TaxID=64659 RepID=A0A9P5YCF0_9AGAR|nr:hypothetical protein BDZ94DRAFT_1252170 [Collybia nuda]
MTDIPSSPERPSVKITYLERQKRKRPIADCADDPSDSESNNSEIKASIPVSNSKHPSATMITSLNKAPESKGPKKIEFNLPGPAPKRPRKISEEGGAAPSPSTKPLKSLHARASSSSLARVAKQVEAAASSPTSSKKPPSVASIRSAKRPLSRRGETPDSEADEGASVTASVADSTISVTTIRRTEDERLAYFKNQPDLGELEDHRAQCTRCGKFVALGKKQKYTVRPWENHRKRCDALVVDSPSGNAETPSKEETNGGKVRLKTAAQRKEILEADAFILAVQPHDVQCRKCEKWIRLSNTQEYANNNWNIHRKSCCEATPSNRVATATRKLQIVNDPLAKSFGPSHVDCALCDKKIELSGEGTYNLTDWEAHKETCPSKPIQPKQNSRASKEPIPFPSRPPPSSASTEGTLISADSNILVGMKRLRDDPEPADDSDTRPSNRPRDEKYEPPQKEAPSAMGWFMLPLKAFVRGFRESLKTS